MTITGAGGCSGVQSTLDPAGPAAAAVAWLWWGMFGFSVLVVLAVVSLWIYAMRREPEPLPPEQARRTERRWLIGGGLVLPVVSLSVLLAFGIPMGHRLLPLPLAEPPMRIEVIGRQWWWQIRYPGAGVVVANTLHLPTGTPIDIHASTADVVHSFWIPRLGGKIDTIPGRTNVLRIVADEPGLYRGQCAEFCGTGHAGMVLLVQAHTPEDFLDWLASQRSGGTRVEIDPAVGEEYREAPADD